MSFGGGGGGYNSVSTSQPWQTQSKYLSPLFNAASYGASGKIINPNYGDTIGTGQGNVPKGTNVTDQWLEPSSDVALSKWFSNVWDNTSNASPGKLDYFGNVKNLWNTNEDIVTALAGGNTGTTGGSTGAPTVAKFTPDELTAQTLAENLAKSRTGNNYNSSILGQSDTALKNIITGTNKIPYWNINTPTIASPGTITGADINYTPNMQAANFDYKYWNDLGNVASGQGGNEWLDKMVEAAQRNTTNRYKNDILPYLNSSAEQAGAGGSGGWADLRANETQNYNNAMSDIEANLRGNAFNSQLQAQLSALGLGGEFAGKAADYTQEANQLNTQLGLQKATTEAGYTQQANIQNIANALQKNIAQANMEADINKQNALLGTSTNTQNIANIMQGVTQAPDINSSGYNDIGALSATGAEQRQYNQDVLNAYIQRMEQMQLEPWNRLGLVSSLIGGNFGGTATQTAQNK